MGHGPAEQDSSKQKRSVQAGAASPDRPPVTDLKSRLARGVAWTAVARWGRLVVSFISFTILARVLGPEPYGLSAMVFAILTLCQVVFGGALVESLIQHKKLEPAHCDTMYWTMQIVTSLLCLGFFAGAPWIATYYGQPALTELLQVAILTSLIQAQSVVPDALLRRNLRFGSLALASTSAIVCASSLGVAMAISGYGVWSLIAMPIAHATVYAVVVWVRSGWLPGGSATWRHFKDLSRFNLSVLLLRLVNWIEQAMPALVIGPELGPAVLGLYTMARKLVELLAEAVVGPVRNIAFPAFARVSGDLPKVRRLLLGGIRLTTTITFPAFVGAILVAPYLVPLALGAKWSGSVIIFQVLALRGLLMGIGTFHGSLLRGLGRPHWQLFVSCISTGLGAMLLVLTVDYGIVAVVVALELRGFLLWPLGAYLVQRVTNVGLVRQLGQVLVAVIASLIMIVCVLSWQLALVESFNTVVLLGSMVAMGIASYGVVVVLLGKQTLLEAMEFARSMRPKSRAAASRLDERDAGTDSGPNL